MRFPVLSEVKLSLILCHSLLWMTLVSLLFHRSNVQFLAPLLAAPPRASARSQKEIVVYSAHFCTKDMKSYEKNVLAATSSDTADNETSQNLKATVDHAVEMKFTDCETSLAEFCNASTQIEDCIGCKSCYNKNRILKNKVIDLKAQLQDKNKSLSHMKKGSYCGLIVRANKKKAIHRTLLCLFIYFFYFFKGIKSYYYSCK